MKGFRTILLSVISVLAFSGMALAADPFLWYNYRVGAELLGGKASYGNATFTSVNISWEEDRPKTAADESAVGTFIVKGATFDWQNWGGSVVNGVEGTDKSFELRYESGDDTGVLFHPYEGGNFLQFVRRSETGLAGKTIEWNLLGRNGSFTVPNFRSVEQQKATYVPYVELVTDGTGDITGITWRFVLPSDPSKAIQTAAGKLRIGLKKKDGSRVFQSNYEDFAAGTPGSSVAVPAGTLKADDLGKVYIDWYDYSFSRTEARYGWDFTPGVGPVNPTNTPVPTHKPSSSSGGCNAGFAWSFLVLALPLFFRRNSTR